MIVSSIKKVIEQAEYPDIDTDVDGRHRDDILNYLVNKYGDEQVALVGNVLYYSGKSAIRDLARVYEIPASKTFEATKEYDNAMTVEQNIRNSQKVKEYFDAYPEMVDKVDRLCGTVSSLGIHAGGVVITDREYPISKYCALQRSKEDSRIATLWPKKELQQLGLIKYDLLGLATAGQLKIMCDMLGLDQYSDMPEEKEVFDDVVLNIKHKNIFQFETQLGKNAFMDFKPMSIMELANASGIIRVVGSTAGRQTYETYKENVINYQMGDKTHWEEKLRNEVANDENYLICKDVLKESYGVLIYQEQLAYLVVKLSRGRFDFNDGNKVRKLLDKHGGKYGPIDNYQGNAEKLQAWHKDFMEIMDKYLLPFITNDGYETQDKTLKAFLEFKLDSNNILPIPKYGIISWMISAAAYLFSKLHAIAYSINSYNMMYFKHFYPLEFWCGSLQYEIGSLEKIKNYIAAMNAEKTKISVVAPNVNKSDYNFKIEGKNKIRYGLGAIHNLGKAAEVIINERHVGGKFKSVEDFLNRIPKKLVNKRHVETLMYVNAFSDFGDKLQDVYDAIKNYGIELDDLEDGASELAKNEIKFLGTSITFKHPIFDTIDLYLPITAIEDGDRENVAVLIQKIHTKTTKTGKPYALLACICLNSGEQFNVFDWGNNKMEFKDGDFTPIHIHKNGGFTTLVMNSGKSSKFNNKTLNKLKR